MLYKQDKNTEALAAFDNILAADPQNGAASYQRAVIYAKMGQTDKAVDAYKKTTKSIRLSRRRGSTSASSITTRAITAKRLMLIRMR